MIREYNLEDIKRINELLCELHYSISNFDVDNNFIKIYVYEVDKIVLGVVIFRVLYEQIEIDYIVVDKEYRRKTIGEKLIKYILENYRDKSITLEVNCNNDIAINFYKKMSFNVVSIRKNYYKNEDAYLMYKDKVES